MAETKAYPFPFLGAGVPSPFEWIGYEIFFRTPPDASAGPELTARFPRALGAKLRGARLSLSGGRPELHHDVASDAGERPDADGFASLQAFTRLAHAVERRLVEIHETHSIRLALMVLDPESDPPKRSKWHTASAKQIPSLLTTLFAHVLEDPAHEDAELARQLIAYAAMSRIKLPPQWKLWSEPGRRLFGYLLTGQLDMAANVLRSHAGDANFVFQLQKIALAVTRDADGSWARSQLAKWPQDVPWGDSSLTAWATHRPLLRRACLDLAAEIASAAAPLTASDLASRDSLLPALGDLAIDEERPDVLLSDAFRRALDTTLPYERRRFLEHLERQAQRAKKPELAQRYRELARSFVDTPTR